MPRILVDVLQVVGILVVAGGFWMQWPWVGVVAVGVGLLVWVVLSDYLAAVPDEPEGS